MENKTGKYFKYAIGEIILVVIGILIALQINNWNQKRLNLNEENEVIAKLHTDFKNNKLILKKFIGELTNEMNANLELISLIGSSEETLSNKNLDSIFFESLAGNELAFADNTIKNLMQSGRLNLLKNERISELLYQWNSLSEIRKTRLDKLDNWSFNQYTPYLISKISFKEMDSNGKFNWSGKSKIKPNYHIVFQEIEFENLLDNTLWLQNQIYERCLDTEKLIDEIIKTTTP